MQANTRPIPEVDIALLDVAPALEATGELTATVPVGAPLASCPLCHTTQPSLTLDALGDSGGDWQCARCDQQWDARRLATVAAYAALVLAQHTTAGGPYSVKYY